MIIICHQKYQQAGKILDTIKPIMIFMLKMYTSIYLPSVGNILKFDFSSNTPHLVTHPTCEN